LTSCYKISNVLRRLYLDELIMLADKLSEGGKQWSYGRRKKANVAKSIASNTSEQEIIQSLRELCGKKIHKSLKRAQPRLQTNVENFPPAIQVRKIVLGPLGFLESVMDRYRSEADEIISLFEKYLKKEGDLKKLVREFQELIPKEAYSEIFVNGKNIKPKLIQAILAYANDKTIRNSINRLLSQGDIELNIPEEYELTSFLPWRITRWGLIPHPENEAIENLTSLLKRNFKEEDLSAELRRWPGDFQTRLLEYCIIENPNEILLHLFGAPALRKITKKLGFVNVAGINDLTQLVTLVLLGLGFNIPPRLIGLHQTLESLFRLERDLKDSVSIKQKSGVMSQVYVETEGLLRDLLSFYISFLWKKDIQRIEEELEYEARELTPSQIKIKALVATVRKRLGIKKSFDRFTFGEFVGIARELNRIIEDTQSLKRKMKKTFNRGWLLPKGLLKSLDEASSYRANFVHPKKFPGDRKCSKILGKLSNFVQELAAQKIFPIALRITREIEDEYGKSYAEAIDESGDRWILYTDKWLDPAPAYFMHSKTPSIAINPVLIEKIRYI